MEVILPLTTTLPEFSGQLCLRNCLECDDLKFEAVVEMTYT